MAPVGRPVGVPELSEVVLEQSWCCLGGSIGFWVASGAVSRKIREILGVGFMLDHFFNDFDLILGPSGRPLGALWEYFFTVFLTTF